MGFGSGFKNIQATAYNCGRTVFVFTGDHGNRDAVMLLNRVGKQ